MKPLMESCWKCENVFYCGYNEFSSCPKIEIAATGMGIPYKPKEESYIRNMPFGVFMRLKKMVKELEGCEL